MMRSPVARVTCCTGLVFVALCHAAINRSGASSAAAPSGTLVVSNMNDDTAMLLDARTIKEAIATASSSSSILRVETRATRDGHS